MAFVYLSMIIGLCSSHLFTEYNQQYLPLLAPPAVTKPSQNILKFCTYVENSFILLLLWNFHILHYDMFCSCVHVFMCSCCCCCPCLRYYCYHVVFCVYPILFTIMYTYYCVDFPTFALIGSLFNDFHHSPSSS
jgi:hypothetical protein